MKFYTTFHKYYCGIDLHARLLYVCILDERGNKLVHQKIKADPHQLHKLLKPYIGQVVVGVECMHCWYWVSDFCCEINVEFILGHALYITNSSGNNLVSFSCPEGKSTGRTFPSYSWRKS